MDIVSSMWDTWIQRIYERIASLMRICSSLNDRKRHWFTIFLRFTSVYLWVRPCFGVFFIDILIILFTMNFNTNIFRDYTNFGGVLLVFF